MFDHMRKGSVTHLYFNGGLNVPFVAAVIVARAVVPQRMHTIGVQQPDDTVGQLNFAARTLRLLMDTVKNAGRKNVAARHRQGTRRRLRSGIFYPYPTR